MKLLEVFKNNSSFSQEILFVEQLKLDMCM